jgi:nitrous oxide reductase accessory protein NosL
MKKSFLLFLLTALLGMANLTFPNGAFTNGTLEVPKKIEVHKECPLCGMYPARYPQFNCQVIFKDGTYEAFDSAAGLLVYLLFSDKTGIIAKPVDKIYFKHYLKENWLEADKTFFVVGSEILGPMGIEFLSVDSEKDAKEVKKQEKGEDIIHFKKINRQYMVKAAKEGWLHFLAKKLVTDEN